MAEAVGSGTNVGMRRTPGAVVLSLAPGSACGTYAPVADALAKSGFTVIPDTAPDGSCLLRITGFKQHDDVVQKLKAQGLSPKDIAPDFTARRELKLLDRAKANSLSVSGFAYLLGDLSLFTAGMLNGDKREAMAGLAYTSGGAVSALFGNPSEARQIRNVGVHMGDFLVSQGADVSGGSMLKEVLSQRRGGLAEKIENFLMRHPSEVHNLIYAYGGTDLIHSGLNKRTAGKKGAWDNIAAGALVTAGGLVGGLVPEKHVKGKSPSGIIDWIMEKPLRLAGWLYTLNNVFLIKGALADHEEHPTKKGYIFKLATAGFFLIANAFMSMTSRDHNAQGAAAEDKRHVLEGMAAEVIAAQPEGSRADLTRKVAGFLSMQPEVRGDKAMLEASLARKVEALGNSPWRQASASVPLQVAPERTVGKNWAERTAPAPAVLAPGLGA